jgi:hypothetical protein
VNGYVHSWGSSRLQSLDRGLGETQNLSERDEEKNSKAPIRIGSVAIVCRLTD